MSGASSPLTRELLTPALWVQAVAEPASAELLALWADTACAHALLSDGGTIRAVSVEIVGGAYPALSPHRRVAAWFERMIADLWGHRADGARDLRPWLDHGRWPHTAPLSPKPLPHSKPAEPPELLAVVGDDLHQLPLGPIRDIIAEPSHLRVHASGERIVRVEALLGYAHKGTLGLMRGKSPRAAARFASRLSGDATVAHATAFARAAEAATGTEAPPRAAALRGVMAELERISGHLADVAATAQAAGGDLIAGHAMRLRETTLRAAAAAFESRLMLDAVIPGGIATDIAAGGTDAILRVADTLAAGLSLLVQEYAAYPGLAERLRGVGRVSPDHVAQLSPGGVIGRAAGREFDLRDAPGYAPYARAPVGVAREGCADARTRVRLAEAQDSIGLLRKLLLDLPEGGVSVPLPMASGEGFGWSEAHRGDVWHWLRLDGGMIASVFMRDPSWLHWPLLEDACAGADAADIEMIEASFGCSCSGVDL